MIGPAGRESRRLLWCVVKQISVCASKERHNEGGRKVQWCEMRQMSVSGALCMCVFTVVWGCSSIGVWLLICACFLCVCVGGSCVITVSKHFCHSGVLTHTEPAAVVCGRPSPVALPVWLCQHVKLQLSDWLPFLSFSSFVQPKLCSHVCYTRQLTHTEHGRLVRLVSFFLSSVSSFSPTSLDVSSSKRFFGSKSKLQIGQNSWNKRSLFFPQLLQ